MISTKMNKQELHKANENKILFLSVLPPPFYGSAMSSQTCLEVLQQDKDLKIFNIKTNFSKKFDDVGKMSLAKIGGFFYILNKIIVYSIKNKPDLVYIMPATAGFAFIRDFAFAFALKLMKKNIIYHLRTRITDEDKNNRIKNYILKKAFKNCKVIVLGQELKSNIKTYFHEDDIFILPNAVQQTLNNEMYEKIEKERLTGSGSRLVFISNMMKPKGWPVTIEAANILNQMNINFSLIFAGSWPSDKEKDEFYNLVTKYKLNDKVSYAGYVDAEGKNNLLANSDILVFPTEYKFEALPRVIIEAFEYGLPVITTRNGSIPDMVIHNKTGFLLSGNSAKEIAGHIVALSDKRHLVNIGRESRKRFLDNYELSIFKNNFLNIIKHNLRESEYLS
jgi:glycosyltransferase involved in cell wall biosynthesis